MFKSSSMQIYLFAYAKAHWNSKNKPSWAKTWRVIENNEFKQQKCLEAWRSKQKMEGKVSSHEKVNFFLWKQFIVIFKQYNNRKQVFSFRLNNTKQLLFLANLHSQRKYFPFSLYQKSYLLK